MAALLGDNPVGLSLWMCVIMFVPLALPMGIILWLRKRALEAEEKAGSGTPRSGS
jgi:hypothetical protein